MLPLEYAVRNLGRSPRRLVAIVLGSALVVGLVLTASAFVHAMRASMSAVGLHQNVLLLGAGSEDSVERSQLAASIPEIVRASLPGLRTRLGIPYLSPEVYMATLVRPGRADAPECPALLRGVTTAAFLVYPQVRIVAGRAPRAGCEEIMVGKLAAARLGVKSSMLDIGRILWFDGRPWTITGHFVAPGSVQQAEIWFPLTDLQVATRRHSLSCVVLALDEARFADVDAFCKQRLDLELVALRESDYYASLLALYRPIRVLTWVTALLIALAGLLGGLNTMYAAFASRVRELGALQTLGFSRLAISASVVQESMLATMAGSLLAVAVGLVILDGVAVRISMGAFGLAVDSTVVLTALVAGLTLGVLGALPPVWRCLRLPIPEALRSG